jgi:hypothetical protein
MVQISYDDIYCHQSILKSLLKVAEPNLVTFFIGEPMNSHTIFTETSVNNQIKQIGYIVVGIRDGPGNYTSKQAALIFDNGYIHNIYLSELMLHYAQAWIYLVEDEKQRYNRRISAIKDELIATCYHPDNFRRLLDMRENS